MAINTLYFLFFIGLYSMIRKGPVYGNPTELELNYSTDDRFRVGISHDDNYITTIFPSSLFLCLKECTRRSPCEYIVFKKSTLECFLLEILGTSNVNTGDEEDYVSSGLQYWNNTAEWFGECANVNCTETSSCIMTSQSGPRCITYKCNEDPQQTNLITPHGNQVGDRALYTCPGAYEIYQNVSSHCLPNGQWSAPTICHHCGDPPIVNNSMLQEPITHQQDEVIWYDCPRSYETHQNITSTCQGSAEWTTPTHCKHCGDPPFVNNSQQTEPLTHLEGEEIRYYCPRSFLEDQNITSTCQSNTTWTQPTSCKYCDDPPEIVGGVITEPVFHQQGETIEYTCPDAYIVTQNITSTCQADTQWTQAKNCQHCGEPPEVQNGEINQLVHHIKNETITYTCAKSYLREQNITSTCQDNGTWTTPNTCKLITEPVFHQEGETIDYTCPDAYIVTQNITSTCQADTWWTPAENCRHCGDPPFVNNSQQTEPITNLEGEEIGYFCPGSFLEDQNITSTCQSNTTWTQPTSCKYCDDPPEIVGGVITEPVFHQQGETIEYTCPDAYIVTQNITSTCQADTWWTPAENCRHCGDPPFVNNSQQTDPLTHLEGEVIIYYCPGSFLEDQNITSTCQSNTTWTQPTSCKHCGEPPQEGRISQPSNYLEGDVVYYDCGLTNISSTCQSDGEWGYPHCPVTLGCGPPPELPEASPMTGTMTNYYSVNEEVDYNCTSKAIPYFAKSTCQSGSSWSAPKCSVGLEDCQDLQRCNAELTDGDYWLFPGTLSNVATKIYCHDLEGTPEEFISLPSGNIVSVANFEQSLPSCEEMNGTGPAYNVTEFFKIRMDISKLVIKEADFTFTNTSEPNVYYRYGEGRGCSYTTADVKNNCPPKGYFSLNLTGTGLAIKNPESEWMASGEHGYCNVTSLSDVEYKGEVDGNCGECRAGPIYITGSNEELPVSAATVPHCSSN